MTTLVAPAKLTISLRVTGVRADGYHELDAEMVTLDLADLLEVDEAGSGLEVEAGPGLRASELPAPADNLVTRALNACGRRAGVRLSKRIPLGDMDKKFVVRYEYEISYDKGTILDTSLP